MLVMMGRVDVMAARSVERYGWAPGKNALNQQPTDQDQLALAADPQPEPDR